LQSISKGNHEALYLRLANGNLRTFHVEQVSMTASRVLAWAVVYFSAKRYFSGPSSEEVVYGSTLLLLLLLNGEQKS
jgi:hypothetical protein